MRDLDTIERLRDIIENHEEEVYRLKEEELRIQRRIKELERAASIRREMLSCYEEGI